MATCEFGYKSGISYTTKAWDNYSYFFTREHIGDVRPDVPAAGGSRKHGIQSCDVRSENLCVNLEIHLQSIGDVSIH